MRLIITFFLVFIGHLLHAQQRGTASLSGTINLDSAYALFVSPIGVNGSSDTYPLSADGKFSWSAQLDEPQWLMVDFVRRAKDFQLGASFPIYLHPGQELVLDLHYSDSTYLELVGGDVDNENRSLILYSGYTHRQDRKNFMDVPTEENLRTRAQDYIQEIERLIARLDVRDPSVRDYLNLWAHNNYLGLVFNRRGHLTEDPRLLPDHITETIDDERMLWFYNGYLLTNRYVDYRFGQVDAGSEGRPRSASERLSRLQRKFDFARTLFDTPQIIDRLILGDLESFVRSYRVGDLDEFDQDQQRLAAVAVQVSNDRQREQLLRSFQNLRYTKEGSAMPDVPFLDRNGREVRLTDFAGSYIYIDLWASWCVPCIREIPHLHQLEEDYKDKNIVFLSISLDRDKQAWRNKMDELDLVGHQWELGASEFDKLMNVAGIPHFLLYDPEGKLLQYKAPRPSSEAIRNVFDALVD